MSLLSQIRLLSSRERHVIVASYLGWTLDAFDFFILVFVLKSIAADFHTTIKEVTLAISLTLAMRPLGALVFGFLADRLGRRKTLMINVLIYSLLEFSSGFAPSLTVFIIFRALYGIAMGGEWGVGAALTLESVSPKMRGFVSGILQTGYPSGYLLASIVFFTLFPLLGWRGMFMVGVLPALLVLYIRRNVSESPAFEARQHQKSPINLRKIFKSHLALSLWAILMMTGFNFLSHGTQDLYPTFLEQQMGLSHQTVGLIAIIYNVGAILGGLTFGILSERIGRKRSILLALLFVLPIIPLWAHAQSIVGLAAGAFLIQFFVQGAWGVVPVHLNEISPDEIQGTFPGLVYQLGNLFASYNATLQAGIAINHGGDYGFALTYVAGIAALVLALLVFGGREAQGRRFGPQ